MRRPRTRRSKWVRGRMISQSHPMWQINEIASRRLEGAGTRGVGPPAAARVVGVRVMGAPLVSLCVATMVFAYSGGAVAQKGTTFAETAPRTESGVQLGALPSFEAVRTAHRPSQRLILDRYGEPLAALRTDFNERRDAWVSLEAMAPIMQRAVLLSEDRRFHEHGGVDWAALASAGFGWLTGERSEERRVGEEGSSRRSRAAPKHA